MTSNISNRTRIQSLIMRCLVVCLLGLSSSALSESSGRLVLYSLALIWQPAISRLLALLICHSPIDSASQSQSMNPSYRRLERETGFVAASAMAASNLHSTLNQVEIRVRFNNSLAVLAKGFCWRHKQVCPCPEEWKIGCADMKSTA